MSDFKDRLEIEKNQLEDKHMNLGIFLHQGKHRKLSENQSNLLTIQHNIMGTYLNILEMRLSDID